MGGCPLSRNKSEALSRDSLLRRRDGVSPRPRRAGEAQKGSNASAGLVQVTLDLSVQRALSKNHIEARPLPAQARCGLASPVHRELLEDAVHVILDGRRLDSESRRNLLVREPPLDQTQHRGLTRAQLLWRRRPRPLRAKLDEPSHHGSRDAWGAMKLVAKGAAYDLLHVAQGGLSGYEPGQARREERQNPGLVGPAIQGDEG